MIYGYARVSTQDQDTRAQIDALTNAGAQRVYQEKRSGGTLRRPELDALLSALTAGDTVLVYKLDRVARSLADLLTILARIEAAGASFRSLTEIIDTASPAGRMMLQILGAFAEFERQLIRERTRAGLQAAKARGAPIGRPRSMTKEDEASAVTRWRNRHESHVTLTELARDYGCHLSSIKRAIDRADAWEKPRANPPKADRTLVPSGPEPRTRVSAHSGNDPFRKQPGTAFDTDRAGDTAEPRPRQGQAGKPVPSAALTRSSLCCA
ncbi:MAG: recombinase family protein [Pseudomonadota bacterium]